MNQKQDYPALRQYRNALGVSQAAFANALGVSVETYRTWDSGRRTPSPGVVNRAKSLVESDADVPIPLRVLAGQFSVHVRTLRQAARDGRLTAVFETKTYFGHVIARATRSAIREFLRSGYRKSASQVGCKAQVATPPADFASRIIALRRRLHLTQTALARRIGAANKAVVYQWETGKRKPSPFLWSRLERLQRRRR